MQRWKESGERQLTSWIKTLDTLKEKLESPQPPEKKVYKYRLYRCKWHLGDVYAYRFFGNYSKEKGFYEKYTVFRKVSEYSWWPGHIVPVVQVYKWVGDNVPSLDKLSSFGTLPTSYDLDLSPEESPDGILLISESDKTIPKDNLMFLGNLPGNDLIPFRGHDYWLNYIPVGWETSKYNEKFEHYVIDMYLACSNNK